MHESFADILIRELDLATVESLAMYARFRALSAHPPLTTPDGLTCTISSPPKQGGFNVVYEAQFSDGVSWAVRIPSLPWNPGHERSMRLDMVGLEYVVTNTSLPIPRVHAYDCTADNTFGHPYIIMDYIHGTRLVDVWNEPSWWTGERSKERLLTSIAGYMVELAKHEFDQIGCLDHTEPDGPYHVVPIPASCLFNDDVKPSKPEYGPFTSADTYLRTSLDEHCKGTDSIIAQSSLVTMLRMYLAILPDARFDGAPFVLGHPDFDSQNIILDDSGNIAAFIDWDGIATQPRQLGALTYPSWLTVDWDPLMYAAYKENPHCDTEADLHAYRKLYSDAVDALSGGAFGDAVRNSHVVSTLAIAVFQPMTRSEIVTHIGKYFFGSGEFPWDIVIRIEGGSWLSQDSKDVARVVGKSSIMGHVVCCEDRLTV